MLHLQFPRNKQILQLSCCCNTHTHTLSLFFFFFFFFFFSNMSDLKKSCKRKKTTLLRETLF